MEHIDQDNTQQEDETNGELKAEDLDSEDDYDGVDAANNKELQRTQDSQFVYFILFFDLVNFIILVFKMISIKT